MWSKGGFWMRVLTFSIAALPLLVTAGIAREESPTPKGPAPEYCLAWAGRKDKGVAIRIYRLEVTGVEYLDGKEVWKTRWIAPKTLLLGEQVRAYRPTGKAVQPNDVLKALAKPTVVACFIGTMGLKPSEPDPLYLGLLREGSVALAFEVPAPPP
jgi:hypothetical protein